METRSNLVEVVLAKEPTPDWKGGGAVPKEWSASGTLESGEIAWAGRSRSAGHS